MTKNKYTMKKYFKGLLVAVLFFVAAIQVSYAQVNSFNAQFYQNQYLANPAMAGVKPELKLNLGIRDRFRNVEGAPNSQSLTADLGFKQNSGFGINLSQSSANILSKTKVAVAYAYHLPISENSKLHFGISAGYISQKLNRFKIVGANDDPLLMQYNDRSPVFDGDFGLAYTFKNLTVQGVVYNGIQQLDKSKDALDLNRYYAAAAYRVDYKGFGITPKVAYRKIESFDDIFDGGLELSALNEDIKLSGIYHSNQSFSASLSYEFLSRVQFLLMFNSQSNTTKNYSPEEFELGLQIRLQKPNK
jgi:type IX secretion system PorP/SprF family membrane protein